MALLRTTLAALGVEKVEPLGVASPVDAAAAERTLIDRVLIVRVPPGGAGRVRAAIESLGIPKVRVEAACVGHILDNPPNDPMFPNQHGLANGRRPGADVHALGAWQRTVGSPEVTIAVIDTGISHSHPDLAGNLVRGQNFANGDADNADDSNFISHGTFVAGVAGAIGGNGTGVAGTCWNARLMPVRVANRYGFSSDAQCAAGIIWAVDHGARVLNVSMGFPQAGDVLAAAVEYAHARGAIVCASSGNSPGLPIPAPARYPGVLCVGATDTDDEVAAFVSTGPQMMLCAPGVDILTTEDMTGNPNSFGEQTGTSMACPFVAGAAALVWSMNPQLGAEQVKAILIASADDIDAPGWDERSGWGRLNAERAVTLADPVAQPRCQVDWNGDGGVTSEDFFAFLDDYLRYDADYNFDGRTDSDDFFDFIVSFFSGC